MRRDLLQEIHIELWRRFRLFDGLCSLQTWVYRVAHNVAASHIVRSRRASGRLVDLDALETEPAFVDGEIQANQRLSVSRLLDRIRQIILLYLEGEQAASDCGNHGTFGGQRRDQDSPPQEAAKPAIGRRNEACTKMIGSNPTKNCGSLRRKSQCRYRLMKCAPWRADMKENLLLRAFDTAARPAQDGSGGALPRIPATRI